MKALCLIVLALFAAGCSTTDHRTATHLAPLHDDIVAQIKEVQELCDRRAKLHAKIRQLYVYHRPAFSEDHWFPNIWACHSHLPVPSPGLYCDNQKALLTALQAVEQELVQEIQWMKTIIVNAE